jgi:hypothetical protein
MQGLIGKKKEEHKLVGEQKQEEAPKLSQFDHRQMMLPSQKKENCELLSISMSEGLMLARSNDESKKVGEQGRASFEKSVRIELKSLSGKKTVVKGKKPIDRKWRRDPKK